MGRQEPLPAGFSGALPDPALQSPEQGVQIPRPGLPPPKGYTMDINDLTIKQANLAAMFGEYGAARASPHIEKKCIIRGYASGGGDGDGGGYGSGHGSVSSSGYGDGSGSGSGHGGGEGSGYGDGFGGFGGSNYGYGDGCGSGNGCGSGLGD